MGVGIREGLSKEEMFRLRPDASTYKKQGDHRAYNHHLLSETVFYLSLVPFNF